MKFQTLTLDQENITDFASARNKLLKSAKIDWVLFLDTDEILSSELNREIKTLDPKNYSGFFLKRKIVFVGKDIGEDKVLRLARKDAGKWDRKVHETWHVKGKVGTLKNYIFHHTADNLSSYINKINKYSGLHAKENINEHKKCSLIKIIFYPPIKFFLNIIQGRGFVFSMLQSFHSFLGWTKQWELQKK